MLSLLPTHLLAFLSAPSALLAIGVAELRLAGMGVLFLLAAVTVHEFAHAFVAHRLGDPTPQAEGRLNLNPLSHADPVGTLALPLLLPLLAPGFLFGWGRPVHTLPHRYRRSVSMRFGSALVAVAGPLANLLLAGLTLGVVWALGQAGVVQGPLDLQSPIRLFFTLNIILFVFNLIPLHPLDGGKVLTWLMGAKFDRVDDFLRKWGGWIVLLLVLSPIPVLSYLLTPFYRWGNVLLDAVV